jgi:hypothetical protein
MEYPTEFYFRQKGIISSLLGISSAIWAFKWGLFFRDKSQPWVSPKRYGHV